MSNNQPLTPAELLVLRNRLDDIDSGIVDLIAERQAVVTTIAEHKLKTGLPLRHYEREREVIDRGVARAESLGLSGSVARDILQTLIHHSLSNQETHKLVHSEHGHGQDLVALAPTLSESIFSTFKLKKVAGIQLLLPTQTTTQIL